ncbi:dihydropteroate synthase [Niabella ginsenosidivorans]|uniref:dihydropteroate synthase n=1 Tax=Niabella ginsenosidivorans TaxID=1176587 RepID=A0A1A9I1G7_9BACT|nr:dihydropteroate synthase [Niabella ginsenosidivorans]ANH81363.1 dihydropteroate synthase [Niabella ginsenosidivorans]
MLTLNCRGKFISLQKPLVMGILNITTDSFFTGSRHKTDTALLKKAEEMLKSGAAMLDIGGQSTRPGSQLLSADEEAGAAIPAVALLHRYFPEAILSIDTFYGKVAMEAVAAGASLINDISAGTLDANMLTTVASLKVPYVLMHMQGTPQTMQTRPHYENVTLEVLDFFIKKTGALKALGINDLIIDPGFGFGKTNRHNFTLLRHLQVFSMLGYPVLLGVSRKGTIYKTLGITAAEALNGTTVLNTIGTLNGACLLRVHDVKEATEVIRLYERYQNS